MLDGGSNNKTIVEQTLEIMARMKLAPNQDYTFDKDGKVIGFVSVMYMTAIPSTDAIMQSQVNVFHITSF